MIKIRKRAGRRLQGIVGAAGVLFVFVCYQNMSAVGKGPAIRQIGHYVQEKMAVKAWKNCMPVMLGQEPEDRGSQDIGDILKQAAVRLFPVAEYTEKLEEYDIQIESEFSYERAVKEENQQAMEAEQTIDILPAQENVLQQTAEETGIEKAVEIPREKLYDFDYLVHSFYQVDRTTTIDGTQLNPDSLLGKSMKLTGGKEKPQILIYHTHSQEGYRDSVPGNPDTTVVGVGEYLAGILRNTYGFNVIHHTGEYDVKDRDNAYSYAGPAVERLLAENPSVEVVIDLHRDGVAETTRLVSEVNGKQTAKVMFFNGLSRTTRNGDLTNMPNRYIADNLAFSFQMKLAAEEYYPGYTRPVYLKGYRYNMHYCPKSLLVEVGAQTNTLQEAMNAMEPLADLLHKVLTQEEEK